MRHEAKLGYAVIAATALLFIAAFLHLVLTTPLNTINTVAGNVTGGIDATEDASTYAMQAWSNIPIVAALAAMFLLMVKASVEARRPP